MKITITTRIPGTDVIKEICRFETSASLFSSVYFAIMNLLLALITAVAESDVTDHLSTVLLDFENFAENFQLLLGDETRFSHVMELLDRLQLLLDEKKSIKVTLFLLFRISAVPKVRLVLANHRLLQSVLQTDGYLARRFQTFTQLFSAEQFYMDTVYSDAVCTFVLSSINIARSNRYLLQFIAALSSHDADRALIVRTGILSVFSQLFLSASCDKGISLTILSHLAEAHVAIPQTLLIVSCLMQDLHDNRTGKFHILRTLGLLLELAPDNVQERDLRNPILPLLAESQDPLLLMLVLRILSQVGGNLLRHMYRWVLQHVFKIMTYDKMQYLQLIETCLQFISSPALCYDLEVFLTQTKLFDYLDGVLSHLNQAEPAYARLANLRDAVTNTDVTLGMDESSQYESNVQ
jgi:hypothetical protein